MRPRLDFGQPVASRSVEAAVGAELDVGRQRRREKRFRFTDLVRGTFGSERVGVDAAARDGALEVLDEKVAGVGGIEAGAGVVLDARGSILDVADRGQQVGGLARVALVPEFLGVPRASLSERGELVADPPAAVAALDDVHEAFLVAVVAVVIAGEEVAKFVEDERLRVARPGEQFGASRRDCSGGPRPCRQCRSPPSLVFTVAPRSPLLK